MSNYISKEEAKEETKWFD